MEESLAGKLLVATPRLVDPNFYRTVILLLQHDEEGAVGVVLNRVTTETVAEHLPDWAGRATPPGYIHWGGPVEPDVAIGISLTPDGMPTNVPGLSLIDLSEVPEKGPSVRVYSGYSGWSPGQLEAEIHAGSWYVVQAAPDDPFDDPADQWRRILRRQPGLLALISTFPDDVRLN
ncbi:MAG: YqgE/AlgH family protein [Acidimicrobiia bacterium]